MAWLFANGFSMGPDRGDYETPVSPYTPLAAKNVTESVLGYLQAEMRSIH